MYLHASVGFLRSFTYKIFHNTRTVVHRFALIFASSYNRRTQDCPYLVINDYWETTKTKTKIRFNKTRSKDKLMNREQKVSTIFYKNKYNTSKFDYDSEFCENLENEAFLKQ